MGPFHELLGDQMTFHGCPGQVLGVRMALAGCGALGIEEPRAMGKRLMAFVESDRCVSDAIQALTGCSLSWGARKPSEYGKMAATFVHVGTGEAVRVVVREDAGERAGAYAPGVADSRRVQILAYQAMPEAELLALESVAIGPGRLDRGRISDADLSPPALLRP